MSARPISEIIAPIAAEAERLRIYQNLLDIVQWDGRRKMLICLWYEQGLLDADQCEMLISANMLEGA